MDETLKKCIMNINYFSVITVIMNILYINIERKRESEWEGKRVINIMHIINFTELFDICNKEKIIQKTIIQL